MPPPTTNDVALAEPAAWAASLVTQLKYLQTNLAEESPENRQVYLEEDLRRALQTVPAARRGSYLYALVQKLPEWELAAATVTAPAAIARQTPDEVVRSFLQLAPQLSGEQRENIKQKLAALGLIAASKQAIEGEALTGIRTRLKLDPEDAIDTQQVGKLFAVFAEAILALDQLAWNVWRNAAPKSPIRRDTAQGDLRTVTRRSLTGDAESAAAHVLVQKQVEATRQLIAGLLAGLGPAGKNFARRYQQRYTPDAVREVVRAEGGGKGDAQYWKKHTELAAGITETVIEDDVQAAVVKYAEDLMGGAKRD
ncbi:MAG TPA: hypothetical protein VKC51_02880 [Lacunisphaera sp.]|nr:hypothetical protein [Lacunisphaera sp.]